jgi:pseudaminic acid cytidylyltransferase
MSNAVCIIPARGGSRRIPRKNIKLFHGKPIIAYSIETARASGLFDQIVVSTDDREIAAVANAYDAAALMRPASMAEDIVGTQEVARHAIEAMAGDGLTFDFACCIYPTAPMMRTMDLFNAFEKMKEYGANFAFSVGTEPLQDAGMFYWGMTKSFLERRPLYGPDSIMFPIPAARVCDINFIDDWIKAENLFAKLNGVTG